MPKHEFDDYIEFYREAQARAISISGETESYFADLRSRLLGRWLPEFLRGRRVILDFGSSDGLMTALVAQHFPHATLHGVDPSRRSLDYARRDHPGIEFSYFDGTTLPFADGTFDLVYAVGVLHHIPSSEHDRTYGEIFRVLKPGGAFALFEMNPWNPVTQIVFAISIVDRHATMFSSRAAKRRLKRFGRVETRYYAYFPAWLSWLRPLEPYLEKILLGTLYAVIVRT